MSPKMRNESEELWTAEQVASFLQMHPQTIYAKARKGQIPSLKIGSALRFRRSDIYDLIERGGDRGETAPEAA